MAQLKLVEGIGEKDLAKLKEAGINSLEKLLDAAATKKDRKELAAKTGIGEDSVLEWANRADLNRIKGVGREYSDLLEASGVDTVPELAKRKPENLYKKICEVNGEKPMVKKLPTQKQVAEWVAQASKLPRKLQY